MFVTSIILRSLHLCEKTVNKKEDGERKTGDRGWGRTASGEWIRLGIMRGTHTIGSFGKLIRRPTQEHGSLRVRRIELWVSGLTSGIPRDKRGKQTIITYTGTWEIVGGKIGLDWECGLWGSQESGSVDVEKSIRETGESGRVGE